MTFFMYACLCGIMCGGSYFLNRFFKYEGIKYSANMFENEDDMDIMGKTFTKNNKYGRF